MVRGLVRSLVRALARGLVVSYAGPTAAELWAEASKPSPDGGSGGTGAPKIDPISFQLIADGDYGLRPVSVPGGSLVAYLIDAPLENQLLRSDDYGNAAWTKVDSTIATDNATAPDGTVSADRITEGVAGTAFVYPAATVAVTANSTVVAKVWAKRGNHDWFRILVADTTAFTNNFRVWFNLNTGVRGGATVGGGTATVDTVNSRIEPSGNEDGWYLCTAVGTVGTGVTTAVVCTVSTDGDFATARVANAERYQWHASLSQFAGVVDRAYNAPLVPTTSAAASRSGDLPTVSGAAYPLNAGPFTLTAILASNKWVAGSLPSFTPRLYAAAATETLVTDRVYSQFTDGGGARTIGAGGAVVTGESFFRVSIVRAASGLTTLYVNGVQKDTLIGSGAVSSFATLFVGSTAGIFGHARGWVTPPAFHDRALSGAEVALLHSDISIGPPVPPVPPAPADGVTFGNGSALTFGDGSPITFG